MHQECHCYHCMKTFETKMYTFCYLTNFLSSKGEVKTWNLWSATSKLFHCSGWPVATSKVIEENLDYKDFLRGHIKEDGLDGLNRLEGRFFYYRTETLKLWGRASPGSYQKRSGSLWCQWCLWKQGYRWSISRMGNQKFSIVERFNSWKRSWDLQDHAGR